MYTIENKRTYYLVDRNKGKTSEIGDYSNLIKVMASMWNRNLDWYKQSETTPYDDFDFSGNDMSLQPVEYFGWKDVRVWDNTNDVLTSRIEKRYGLIRDVKWRAKPYMVIDDTGAIVNVRLFDADIRAAHARRSIRPKQGTTKDATYGEVRFSFSWRIWGTGVYYSGYHFRQGAVPFIHRQKGNYTTKSHVVQLWKNKEEMRPKCRVDWADLWDPKERHVDRCWKSSCKKRHQWEKHMK